MLSEPRRTRRRPTEVYQFVVLNHISSAQHLGPHHRLGRSWPGPHRPTPAGRRALVRAEAALSRSLTRLTAAPRPYPPPPPDAAESPAAAEAAGPWPSSLAFAKSKRRPEPRDRGAGGVGVACAPRPFSEALLTFR
ncbi:MAG: hypothetical protein WKG07_06840 [Hymenobacter sp.]